MWESGKLPVADVTLVEIQRRNCQPGDGRAVHWAEAQFTQRPRTLTDDKDRECQEAAGDHTWGWELEGLVTCRLAWLKSGRSSCVLGES